MPSVLSWKFNTLIALLGLILLSFFVNLFKNFELNDDNLYLFHSISTEAVKDFKSVEQQDYILNESLKLETKDAEEFSERWRMRAQYANNYLISIYLYSFGSKVSKFIGYEGKFNTNFVSVILISFMFSFVVFASMVVAFFRWMDDAALILSVTLTSVILYFTNEYFPRGGQNLFDHGVLNFIKFVINPGYGLTPFGFTPRSHMILLALPIFSLWLRGSIFSAYVGIFFLLYVHNSMAFILVPFLFLTDILFRFQRVLKPNVLLALSAVGLTYLGRESLFNIENQIILWLSGLLILCLSFYFSIKYRPVRSNAGLGSISVLWLCLSIILLWIMVFLGFFFFSFFLPETNFPVWYIFPGRSLAVLRPLIILGIIYYLVQVYHAREVAWKHTCKVSSVLFFLVLASSYQQIRGKFDTRTDAMLSELRTLNLNADTSLIYKKENEAYFYFRLIRDHELRMRRGG